MDVTPLRDVPDYRRLFSATLVATVGSQLTVVAIPFQVYHETHSSFQVGAVSLAGLAPLIIGSLVGGSVGDAVDRRTILMSTAFALSYTSGALAVNAAVAHPAVWLIYVVSAISGGLIGFSSAAQTASVATLVGPRYQASAAALNQITFQVGTIAGPAAAGLLVAFAGLGWVYATDAATWLLSIAFLRALAPMPPAPGASRPGLASIVEGVRFLKGNQPLQGIYIVDLNAMVFGMPRALFPAIALSHLHVGVSGLGYMYSAPGIGAFIGSVGSGWVGRLRRQGLGVIVAVLVWARRSPSSGSSTRSGSRCCCWRSPAGPTWYRPSCAARSCRPPCRRSSAAGSRRSRSRSCRAGRASATWSREPSPPRPRPRSR